MKQFLFILIFYSFVFFLTACGKGGGSSGGGVVTPTEQNLSISLNPDPGSSVVTALNSSYAFKLLINSTPPTGGVKIDITGIKESDNSTQFSQISQTSNNTIKSVDLSLQSLTPGILYVVKIDVTSQTTVSNKVSTSFRIARK